MQTLFGDASGRRGERGPFPFVELLLLLVLFGAVFYEFMLYGAPPRAAVLVGVAVELILVLGFVASWRRGVIWPTQRVKPGPFPWSRFWREQVKGALLLGVLAVGRAPVGLIEVVGGFALAYAGFWVVKWLWANRRRRARVPDDPAST
jgi:hypothetical protein